MTRRVYSIDVRPRELRHGCRSQVWPDEALPPWQSALKRLMGSLAAAPVVVRELWHATGELYGEDLVGLVSVLQLGGLTVLHAESIEGHLPRATSMTLASQVPTARVPAATAVKWRGRVETRLQSLLVMTAGEGRTWGDAAKYAGLQVPADEDSLDECLPPDDHSESDGTVDDASYNAGWSSDGDQRREARDEDPTTFALRVATLNVRGYQRNKPEVLVTALRLKVNVLALIETRSRTRGKVEGEDYALWELGANRAEGKAVLVHTGGHISAEDDAVAPVSASVSAPTACAAIGSHSCGLCLLLAVPSVLVVTVAVAVAVNCASVLWAGATVPLPFVVVRQCLLELPRFAVVPEEGCPRHRHFRARYRDVSLLGTAGTPLFLADGAHRVEGCPPVVASACVATEEPVLGLAALAVLVCTLSRPTFLVPSSVVVGGLFLVAAVGVPLLL